MSHTKQVTRPGVVQRLHGTPISPARDIIVGFVFIAVALLRLIPPFDMAIPTTGLIWISFIGLYGLYRVARGIIKYGHD